MKRYADAKSYTNESELKVWDIVLLKEFGLNKNLYVLLHRMNLYEIVDLGKKMAGLLYAEK